jgi:peptidoglycan/LPS O-acetylase OafA/YrhL
VTGASAVAVTGVTDLAHRRITVRRNSYIDALRGLSIVLVVVLHVQVRVRLQDSFLFRHTHQVVWAFLCRNGHNGVRIFFVISGFLITLTSVARWGSLDRIQVRRFYQLRFARIGPLLLALLAVLSVLHVLQVSGYSIDPGKASLHRALFSALTLHLNWLEAQVGYLPASWDVLWSLSVEEAFYVCFPFVCLALRHRAGRSAVLLLLVLLIAAGPFFRTFEQNHIWNSKGYLGSFDAIGIGCVAALLTYYRALPRRSLPLALIGGAMSLAVLLLERQPCFMLLQRTGLTATILSLGVAALLVAASRAEDPQAAARWLRPLTACGRLSYEIYLTHAFVVLAAVSVFERSNLPIDAAPVLLATVLIVSWALGALVERYISSPANRCLRATPILAAAPTDSIGQSG